MKETERAILRGAVQTVTYQNPDNGYAVLILRTEDGDLVTVVGIIPMVMAGERLVVTGHWLMHPTYGRQFEAEFLERLMPETEREILQYLSARTIRGIGPATAQKIVRAFGSRTLDVLENEPEELASVEGISMKKAYAIQGEFLRQVGVRRLMEFLSAHNLPVELSVRIYRSYGDLAMDAIREDPYLMTDPCFGADFSAVDAFALEIGFEPDNEQRVEAGILFELSHNLGNGHVFIPADKLIEATSALLELSAETIGAGLERLTEQERIKRDTLARYDLCYIPEFYEAEVYVARRIREMAQQSEIPPLNLDRILREIAYESETAYTETQLEAMRLAAESRILIVTGGPGTGKTTTMAGILTVFDRMGLDTLLAAPTGRAAKKLSESTGRDAATIHRLLESQFDAESGEMQFYRDESEPLKADAVIVDETSMVDLMLMFSLLRALRPGCRLVLVGDPDQLPSVGAGNVFSDILRSEAVRTIRLTEIFRQARESLIVMNAHAVNHGEMPELGIKDRDFFFLPRRSGEELAQTIMELCATRLPKRMGIPATEIQVLSPTRKGTSGTEYLNSLLQSALNPAAPGKKERKHGGICFREGDRVMQIRNNYEIVWQRTDGPGSGIGVFNGDVGTIRSIDQMTETLTVDFADKVAQYDFSQLPELEPAYAVTVHKSQGSEYRAVILAALGGSPYLLNRSLLYTALTRAKELLIVVGSEETIRTMVMNDRRQRRYSGLKLRLSQRDGQC
ncbi:MAG: ATP-dependent RecD-like DNA helicase [Oscillospiraceae bacterium]|nr:ATP-dependent RecD-like DNA helicase [Oscillospiraceae bacterium]